ncbi:unnamed protein product [Ilex paraguariensis]|uniref:Uncharacterized protein n=1 Tax=Ilex paraguariensis TaxID=185542 RepID=A0ABC8TUS2_9AQUA
MAKVTIGAATEVVSAGEGTLTGPAERGKEVGTEAASAKVIETEIASIGATSPLLHNRSVLLSTVTRSVLFSTATLQSFEFFAASTLSLLLARDIVGFGGLVWTVEVFYRKYKKNWAEDY